MRGGFAFSGSGHGRQDIHYGGGGADRFDRRVMEHQHQQQAKLEQYAGRGPVLLVDPRSSLPGEEASLRGPTSSLSSQLCVVERPRDVHLINMHSTADMRTTVDLDGLASLFVNCELSRRPGAELKLQVHVGQGGPCTVKVAKTGGLSVFGRVGVADGRLALKCVARRIRTKGGYKNAKFKKLEVRVVVAQANLGAAVNLMKLEKTVPGAHFNLEHNRLDCVRLPCRTVTGAHANVSASGRMLLCAKRSEEDLFAALDELMPFLRECPVEQLPDLPARAAPGDPHRDLRRRDSGEPHPLERREGDDRHRVDRRIRGKQAREFKVRIDREGGAVGLDLIHQSGTTLLIRRIKEGPIQRWNTTPGRDPSDTVQPGDVLIEVNGVAGSSQLMLTTIKGTSSLVFRIRRPGQGQGVIRRDDVSSN